MSQRGFTLLEVLVAAATLSVVLAGAVAFYLSAVRFDQENTAQVFLQSQATLIIDEMSKQIQPAAAIVIPCPGGVADSIQVRNAVELDPANPTGCGATSTCIYCFRRDAAGTGLLEDRPGGGTRNLLSGAPVTLSVTSGSCPDTGGFCPSEVRHNKDVGGVAVPGCVTGAAITLRLRARYPEAPSSYQAMTFTSTIGGRTLPTQPPPPCP